MHLEEKVTLPQNLIKGVVSNQTHRSPLFAICCKPVLLRKAQVSQPSPSPIMVALETWFQLSSLPLIFSAPRQPLISM